MKCKFIFFVFLAFVSEAIAEDPEPPRPTQLKDPKITVYSTNYTEKEFNNPESNKFPYDDVDVPILGKVIFLIVGMDDYKEIRSESHKEDYTKLEGDLKYIHKAHLVVLGCFDIGRKDLHIVDNFINETHGKEIRAFGYGIFNTYYTKHENFCDDSDIGMRLDDFMKLIPGYHGKRTIPPTEYIKPFDPNPKPIESFPMTTLNGRYDPRITVTFILIDGEHMNRFLADETHKEKLSEIAKDVSSRSELVFLLGCYNFQNHYYLIADYIEAWKSTFVARHYMGPMKNENIHVHVHGRGIWSSDFEFLQNGPKQKFISNVDMEEFDQFLELYQPKPSSRHCQYDVYDGNVTKELTFQFVNGEYRPNYENYVFDTSNAAEMKIIFITQDKFDPKHKDRFTDYLQREKVLLIVCHGDISTYPNVISTMLDKHLGNYLKTNGKVLLDTPVDFKPIIRYGDGGQYGKWQAIGFRKILNGLGPNTFVFGAISPRRICGQKRHRST